MMGTTSTQNSGSYRVIFSRTGSGRFLECCYVCKRDGPDLCITRICFSWMIDNSFALNLDCFFDLQLLPKID